MAKLSGEYEVSFQNDEELGNGAGPALSKSVELRRALEAEKNIKRP